MAVILPTGRMAVTFTMIDHNWSFKRYADQNAHIV